MKKNKKSLIIALFSLWGTIAYGADFNPHDFAVPLSFVEQNASKLISFRGDDEEYRYKDISYVKFYHRIENETKVEGNSLIVNPSSYPLSPKYQYRFCVYDLFEIVNPQDNKKHTIALGLPKSFKENYKKR